MKPKAKEITPEAARCGLGQCPAVYELDDGRIALRAIFLSWEERRKHELPSGGTGEDYVVMSREFFDNLCGGAKDVPNG